MNPQRDVRLLDADDEVEPHRHNERGHSTPRAARQIGVAHPAPRVLWALLTPAELRILTGYAHPDRSEVA